jgi:hypothetical protein
MLHSTVETGITGVLMKNIQSKGITVLLTSDFHLASECSATHTT